MRPLSMNMSFVRPSLLNKMDSEAKSEGGPGSVAAARSGLQSNSIPDQRAGGSIIYKGVSNRPLGWKSKKSSKPTLRPSGLNVNVKRWDGVARMSIGWDGLRRDPELWFADGDCLVHLYGRGASRRGPSFKIPFDVLLRADCSPLLEKYLDGFNESPLSDSSTGGLGYFNQRRRGGKFELYIPAPATAERNQSMLYHLATRNFFACLCGRPVVGKHLGGALVALLNTLNEFRTPGAVDNVDDILNYIDEQGYADMRNYPDHALAILAFAEHYQFNDMWIDAFAHCVGMHEEIFDSSEYEEISRVSRSLINRAYFEMEIRLDRCAKSLGNFLDEELSTAHLGLTVSTRAHLDRFRAFFQAYYVSKLGYYPPVVPGSDAAAFPKEIYIMMCDEFKDLYDYLVDEEFTPSDCSSRAAQSGISVLQSVQGFDERHRFQSLVHPLPLLPESPSEESHRFFTSRLSWVKPDKLKLDDRLVALNSLMKASNRQKTKLLECSLVKAYCGFEKQCVFSEAKEDKKARISPATARKVRWILVYAMLQTLLSCTRVPEQVRDTFDVPYHLCVQTAGCPPWSGKKPYQTLLQIQTTCSPTEPLALSIPECTSSIRTPKPEISPSSITNDIKPDIDHVKIARRVQHSPPSTRHQSIIGLSKSLSISMRPRPGTVRRALSSLGNMPELRHPKPIRTSYHEILVHGYGNGMNPVSVSSSTPTSAAAAEGGASNDLSASSNEGASEGWSQSTESSDDRSTENSSPRSSVGECAVQPLNLRSQNQRLKRKPTFRDIFEGGMTLRKKASSVYVDVEVGSGAGEEGEELDIESLPGFIRVEREVQVEIKYEDGCGTRTPVLEEVERDGKERDLEPDADVESCYELHKELESYLSS